MPPVNVDNVELKSESLREEKEDDDDKTLRETRWATRVKRSNWLYKKINFFQKS
jgi:hypothetical protein